MQHLYMNTVIKFFFLLTPFFLLSTFLSMTGPMPDLIRKRIALKVTLAIIIISMILLLIGNQIFSIFGITLNSFRIGTGILLFLSAKSLVQGTGTIQNTEGDEEVAVVPLAIPVAIGPATTGALLVMSGDMASTSHLIVAMLAVLTAVVFTGLLLFVSSYFEKILKRQGLAILSKITGLILAAMAAEMVMTGVKGFL
ncbi:MAG: MarC family protein [Spirochaetota bacterium]